MNTVFVVMVNDMHSDPEPHLFAAEDDALAFARKTAHGWLNEDDAGDDLGWLYYATHPTEEDSIWVQRKVVS